MQIRKSVILILFLLFAGCGSGGVVNSTFIPRAPADAISNGDNKPSSNTFWVAHNPDNQAFNIAFFADGGGRQATGAFINVSAPGPTIDFNWTKTSPDSIRVQSCSQCTFQVLSDIKGSESAGSFTAHIQTSDGASLDTVFIISSG